MKLQMRAMDIVEKEAPEIELIDDEVRQKVRDKKEEKKAEAMEAIAEKSTASTQRPFTNPRGLHSSFGRGRGRGTNFSFCGTRGMNWGHGRGSRD